MLFVNFVMLFQCEIHIWSKKWFIFHYFLFFRTSRAFTSAPVYKFIGETVHSKSASQCGQHSLLFFSASGKEPLILHSESKVSERNLSIQYIPKVKPTVSNVADIVESNAEDRNGP